MQLSYKNSRRDLIDAMMYRLPFNWLNRLGSIPIMLLAGAVIVLLCLGVYYAFPSSYLQGSFPNRRLFLLFEICVFLILFSFVALGYIGNCVKTFNLNWKVIELLKGSFLYVSFAIFVSIILYFGASIYTYLFILVFFLLLTLALWKPPTIELEIVGNTINVCLKDQRENRSKKMAIDSLASYHRDSLRICLYSNTPDIILIIPRRAFDSDRDFELCSQAIHSNLYIEESSLEKI